MTDKGQTKNEQLQQTEKERTNDVEQPSPGPAKALLKDLAQDQIAIWASPLKVKGPELKWLVPFAGIATGLIVTDRTASREASRAPRVNAANAFSGSGLALAGGSTAGLYFLGWARGDRLMRETGLLGGEAMVDGLIVDDAIKYAFRRQRPIEGPGRGRFFQSGSQNSFPSAHATLSFAFASVLAHEYPGWLTQTLAYGGASAISLARVAGKQHFPSDILVGGTIGYLVGRQVYRAHHDQEAGHSPYGTFEEGPQPLNLNSAGSVYVQLDSWVYPAVERLIALGVIRWPFLGLRPWTRTAVAQMLLEGDLPDSQEASLYAALRVEFAQELGLETGGINESIRVESLYVRIQPIGGTPLNDSYHFGQTVINDFGRPYHQGLNVVSGFTSRAESGRFSFYVRGEYQRAAGAAAYSDSVRGVVAQADLNPIQPAAPFAGANRFALLDAYVGFTAFGHQISVGKQNLWWGAGEGGALILSNNAEPVYMLRVSRITPLYVTGLSRLLGPLRYDHFFGKLSGHRFPADPFIYGDKISFQPTENLEFGFSRTAVFAGQGKTPLTFGTFWNSFTSVTDTGLGIKGTPRDPGARHGAFDFAYRLPLLRNWVTLYSDSIVHDDVSPVDAPRRAAIVPGIHLSHFPAFHKLDLRVESGYTDIGPIRADQSGRFLYWEAIYHDAYLNKNNLLGSWIGRQGKGTQIWSSYWLNPFSVIQVSYRNGKISPQFVPGGGAQNDFSTGARVRIKKDLELSMNFQYEQWNVPALAPGSKADFLGSMQLTFWPKSWVKGRSGQAGTVK
ncbi:MAG TPA: capsule assembly Wzi family protein [Candidatus Saccharimonadales bacterium]|nr:capsule assembly Wzi family protein [Candidatus Saccharimonadales bacterium]